MKTIFKAKIHNIADDGKFFGSCVLCQDFQTYKDAVAEADTHLLSPLSIVEIKEYDDTYNPIVVGGPNDTGILISRNINNILMSLKEKFIEYCKDDNFEGTMSCLIDYIKDESFEDLSSLKDAVNLLTDEEINELLDEYGDSEYVVCRQGKLYSIDKEPDLD